MSTQSLKGVGTARQGYFLLFNVRVIVAGGVDVMGGDAVWSGEDVAGGMEEMKEIGGKMIYENYLGR